jgi:ADP-ribose pyrophosphatase YjhB (NUDIX family)
MSVTVPMASDYVRWLRSRVGHRKIILVRACGLVADGRGRVLLQRHPTFGWWGLPGGLLEPGERFGACLARAVRRRAGLSVTPTRLVGLYTSPDFDLTFPNGDQAQQFIACFACRVNGGVWRAGGDGTRDLACFPPADLPDVPAWCRAMIEDYGADVPAASFRRGSPGDGPTSREYIRRLRRYVGHARLMMVGGAGLVRDGAGRILLIRRSDDGEWALPGGSMELGERIDRAVEREVGEETGLAVSAEWLVGLYAGGPEWIHTYPNGDRAELVTTLFDCRVVGGAPQADGEETLEVRFFPPDRLPPLPECHRIRVRHGLTEREAAYFQ